MHYAKRPIPFGNDLHAILIECEIRSSALSLLAALHLDSPDQAQVSSLVRIRTTPRAPLDRLADALQIAGDPQEWPVLLRRIEYAQAFWDALLRPSGKSGGRASILRQDSRLAGLGRDPIQGIEYDAEGRLSGKI